MKGLKQMVAEATEQIQQAEQTGPEPVLVSGEARYALSQRMRQWSGWSNATVLTGDPRKMGLPSPVAACNHNTHQFVFNTDTLVRNPNKVLLTVTPFRLRQEAILTGAMLHEAGHARHSKWQPSRYGNPAVIHHSDQTPATAQTVALARLMEEPRIEGLMARDEAQIGAATLGWTMRASAAELQQMTALAVDPNQKVMDLITSWALRAGRQYALDARLPNYKMRGWVQGFTTLLSNAIMKHLMDRLDAGALDCKPAADTNKIINALLAMTSCDDDTGPGMIDLARAALDLLFPETPGETEDDKPMPGEGCASDQPEQSEQEQDESPSEEQGEGQAEGDEGDEPESGEESSEQESGEQGDESGEGDDSEQGDDEPDPTEPESDEAGEGEPESSEEEPESEHTEDATSSSGEQGEPEVDKDSDLAKALADMEDMADDQTTEQSEEEADDAEDAAANGAGVGEGSGEGRGWRQPTKPEREIQKGAERFIRTLIDVSESSMVTLSDTPSSSVDGAAMAAWKAGGQRRDPRFFIRTQRNSTPSPPVKVAVLVDVSISMSQLQKPSAILSWALSAAALDLRNYAGRGQQVETTMIHWGSSAKVIQKNGEMLPGIREHSCNQGTTAMHGAMALVEEQMPGFFDITETPVNRLLVQFTDWELYGKLNPTIVPWMQRAMEAGVNMLSVVPSHYSPRKTKLPEIMRGCKVQRGKSELLRYNPKFPEQVWEQAAQTLL